MNQAGKKTTKNKKNKNKNQKTYTNKDGRKLRWWRRYVTGFSFLLRLADCLLQVIAALGRVGQRQWHLVLLWQLLDVLCQSVKKKRKEKEKVSNVLGKWIILKEEWFRERRDIRFWLYLPSISVSRSLWVWRQTSNMRSTPDLMARKRWRCMPILPLTGLTRSSNTSSMRESSVSSLMVASSFFYDKKKTINPSSPTHDNNKRGTWKWGK